MAKIVSINISKQKGIPKSPVSECEIDLKGIIGDAHYASKVRQISLLAEEKINEFGKQTGRKFKPGEFAENITTSGIELEKIPLGSRIQISEVILEVVQLGKKCHGDSCAIFKEVGSCVMPRNGIFCKVIAGGKIKTGDLIKLIDIDK